MKTLQLKAGKEKALLRQHPWIFDNAVAHAEAQLGETVRVISHDAKFLGWAAFSPHSKIRARVWSFEETERIDAAFFERRVRAAIALRSRLDIASSGMRLIHAEADGLPGVIVDRYGDTLVVQLLSSGAQRWHGAIVDALRAITGVQRIYERSDSSTRQLEGLPSRKGWLVHSGDTSTMLTITEHEWQLKLDIEHGHKTGFYLDQRDSRRRFAQAVRTMQLKRVLNCYCYTGGFSVAALIAGAEHVTSIDSSGAALELARQNVALNALEAARTTWMDAEVNTALRALLAQQQSPGAAAFDAIILDPPKFAPTVAQAARAARAYKDINRLALKLLPPGGVLFTYSCSGGIDAGLFHKIVAGAGIDAGVDGLILERLGGAPDHPMSVCFPEGEYLKGLVIVKRQGST